MPSFCGVINCGNNASRDKKSFYRLPCVLKRGADSKKELTAKRREKWLLAINRADLDEKKIVWLRVCEDHFVTGKPATLEDINHPDWTPSKNLGYGVDNSASAFYRYERAQGRSKSIANQVVDDTADAIDDMADVIVDDMEDIIVNATADVIVDGMATQTDPIEMCPTVSLSVQTEVTAMDIANLLQSNKDLTKRLDDANETLRKFSLAESDFSEDDIKTRYYSGLVNFQALMIIFQVISPYINVTPTSALTKFQQFMLTLMHLRLNLDFTDLAYRFGISKATASRVFHNCLCIMHERLNRFVLWPERSVLADKMPEVFLHAFGRKVSVIIDCFEIFIQKPPNVLAAAQTYSHYKHHNTVKYLIGISPQGVITFLSSGWGGRASDKFVVQNCGILEKLLPGDLILADRGFDVKDEVSLYCAEIQVPAFTKGKQQLSPLEIEKTRELAHVRIHVERVIGVLRQKYRILHNVMPISLVKKSTQDGYSVIDRIVTVCSCLTNISPSVVPFD